MYTFRKATLADRDAISKMNVVFRGPEYDYIDYNYNRYCHSWNFQAFVCEYEGKIVSFRFYLLIDGGETVLAHARRVDQDHQGKGLDTKMEVHCLKEISSRWPRVKYLVATQMSDGTIDLSKYSFLPLQITLACDVEGYWTKSDSGKNIKQNIERAGPVVDFAHLKQLKKSDIRTLLTDPENFETVFIDNSVFIGWQRFRCYPDNVEIIFDMHKPAVFVDTPRCRHGRPTSASFCSFYVVAANDVNAIISIYAKGKELALKHAMAQVLHAAVLYWAFVIKFTFHLFCNLRRSELRDALRSVGLQESTWHRRKDPRMIGICALLSEIREMPVAKL